jgi:ABC-2 type transport system ATP-binding protein
MDHGKILALGSPDELKQTVGAATLVGLEASPVTDGLLAALKALPGVRDAEVTPRGVQLYADAAGGLLPKVVQTVMDAGADLRDLSVSEPTLETVFIKLTGRELRE